MRELTASEIQIVTGGSTVSGEAAVIGGAVGGALTQIARGARIGAALGPKGALGGAIIAGTTWGVVNAYSYFRDS